MSFWDLLPLSLILFPLLYISLFYATSSFILQEDDRYEQVSDVRAQLKFFEQLDQMEKQRKEEQEREILLKAAKVSYYNKDTLYHWQEESYTLS